MWQKRVDAGRRWGGVVRQQGEIPGGLGFELRVKVGPDDRGNKLVVAAGLQDTVKYGERVESSDLRCRDRDLKLDVRRFVLGKFYDAVADGLLHTTLVAGGADSPGADSSVRVIEQLLV